ncbi:pentapeptide repeat-containing protein [Amycolatopsis sp. FBCC-B4732]|uniref:NACHT and WD40 repeat domain-containing protein n=1 Tax=Amycolatopsis sp. FBCC-B4732 TaxID=3079339 RepID=UPI001FF4BFE2|nr:pentapeptide repeat-containing protein [Amycolatopsis sp. FBCC-B4732]UOX89931.1 pentapeptide repeat-containing protein [Amycolatopsis sp. FBCC-B4732]
MTSRLQQQEVEQYLETLRPHLTTMQATRLAEISRILDADGRFLLREALEVAEFSGPDSRAQDSFKDFRKRANDAAEKAGVDLRLELDTRKTTPDQRHGWFSGGDLVEKGLVALSEVAAGRTDIRRPVDAEVAELGEPTTRVYLSYHVEAGPMRRTTTLLDQVRESLAADSERKWEVTDSRSVPLGEDITRVRDRLSAEADVRVVLLSAGYLSDKEERRRALDPSRPVVAFALSGLPNGPLDLAPLRWHDVQQQEKPWDELTRAEQRKNYVRILLREIRRALSPGPAVVQDHTATTDDDLMHWTIEVARRQRRDDSRHLVPPEISEASLQESLLDSSQRAASPPLRAVHRIADWATDERPGAPRLCALLGDVGMGKTTTTKLFTQHLLKMRESDAMVPLTILFDLRDVRVAGLAGSMSLDHILDAMLEATRPAGVPSDRLNAAVLRNRLSKGNVVVVFDGLDEVLVHLGPQDRQLFTRQIWRVLGDHPSVRLLLSCRTQYFRTIRDEVTYFTGETRQGIRGSDYLALLMLPFRDKQIREYLVGNLTRGAEWVDRFLETIAAVHDLPDLARRPITLRMIADQVEFIELAKLENRVLRSVDIYSEVVDRWISRDEGKHTLTPEHKRLLMEEIAAELWRSEKNSWSPAEVDDWLLALLDRRPDLQRHYRERVPDLWKSDFRTATFLKREEDSFEFGHRSLFEYFLAQYIYHSLNDRDFRIETIALRVPSAETLDFLGQLISGDLQPQALESLRRVGRSYARQASELALAYALHAKKYDYPHHSLAGVQLGGAYLADMQIDSDQTPLRMPGANFAGADLRRTVFSNIDLSGANFDNADLTNAEIRDSSMRNTRWESARITGTIIRGCDIEGARLDRAAVYRTQALSCTPLHYKVPGLRIAPRSGARPASEDRLVPLFGHTGHVNSVTWSPDGTRILTGGDGGAKIWDRVTGQLLDQFTGHVGSVLVASWSPDGTRILTGGNDSTTRVWNADTGRQLHQLTGRVRAVAWSPDSTRILTGGNDYNAHIWDAETGGQLHQLTAHTGRVRAVAWSPDSTRILTGGDDSTVFLWDADTSRPIHQLTGHNDWVRAVAWSPDSTRILTGGDDSVVYVWDTETGQQLHQLADQTGWVQAVAWSPDGTRILASDSGDTSRIWDANTGQQLHQLTGHTGWVKAAAWSPDGTHVLTGGNDNTARIWDANTGQQLRQLSHRRSTITSATWSPDGTRILTGDDSAIRIWDAGSGEQLHQLTGHSSAITAATWSPDDTRVLTGGDDHTARIWDANTGQQLHQLTAHTGWIESVAWSPDGTRILTGGDDSAVFLWDADTGQQLDEFTAHTKWVQAVAWSPDGTHILASGDDHTIYVWDAENGQPVRELIGHTDWVRAVAWSPDGARILTGGDDHTARIWDASTGQQLHQLTGHTNWVQAVAWSPDGARILTGGDDHTARIWDANTGQQLHQLTAHTGRVRAVAWSPDSTRILTGGDDNTVHIWNPDLESLTNHKFVLLPGDEFAVFDAVTHELVCCSEGAWRSLGWRVTENGHNDYLPAETFGPLPVAKRTGP